MAMNVDENMSPNALNSQQNEFSDFGLHSAHRMGFYSTIPGVLTDFSSAIPGPLPDFQLSSGPYSTEFHLNPADLTHNFGADFSHGLPWVPEFGFHNHHVDGLTPPPHQYGCIQTAFSQPVSSMLPNGDGSSGESQDTTTTASTISPNSCIAQAPSSNQSGSIFLNKSTPQLDFSTKAPLLDHAFNIQNLSSKDSRGRSTRRQPCIQHGIKKQGKRPGRKPHAETNRPKKPLDTYIVLIAEAISSHTPQRATLNEIYAYLKHKYYDFFNNKNYDGWKNSIRHNLSLNQCFTKLEKQAGNSRAGKGHYWAINPDHPPEKLKQKEPITCNKLTAPKKKPSRVGGQQRMQSTLAIGSFNGMDKQMLECFTNETHRPLPSLLDPHSSNNNHALMDANFWDQSSLLLQHTDYNQMITSGSQFYCPPTSVQQMGQFWTTPQMQLDGTANSHTFNPCGLLIPTTSQINPYHFTDPKMEHLEMGEEPFVSNQCGAQFNAQPMVDSNVNVPTEMSNLDEQGEMDQKVKMEQGIPTIDSFYSSPQPTHLHSTPQALAFHTPSFNASNTSFFDTSSSFHFYNDVRNENEEESSVRYEIEADDEEEE